MTQENEQPWKRLDGEPARGFEEVFDNEKIKRFI